MNKQNLLQLQAIQAAKKLDWPSAIEHNEALLQIYPNDIGALNRLGLAYLQLQKNKEAKTAFERVTTIDKSNGIAKKHLEAIKKKQKTKAPTFFKQHFLEEPGTTKIVELHRLASRNVLQQLAIGIECSFKPKNRYISVEIDNNYVGALPEDLSFRLTKLMKTGNKYVCFIHSINDKTCTVSVYIKEVYRSKRNQALNSFPANKTALAAINDVDERFLLEDNIPVAIVETDSDGENTPEIVSTEEEL